MPESLRTFFTDLAHNLRLAAVVDVALLAAFLYVFIAWIRQDTSRGASGRALTFTLLFVLVYSLATIFQLYLVGRLLEVLLIAFLVAAVVLFQMDLRRLLDRIGSWSFFRRPLNGREAPEVVDILTETAANLAEQHTGALIAIRGREPWARLLRGGVRLEGRLSQPLLISIFDDSSPGHDGVVLLEGDCVTHFAVHLPLTENLPEVSRFGGTRHAAALGLAEQCDALVIVVSEERGTISVAEGEHITELASASELKERLTYFWQRHYGQGRAAQGRQNLWRRLQTAALALSLSAVLWLLFAYNPEVAYRTFVIPVEFLNVSSEWALTEIEPAEVQVALTGTQQAFRSLDPSQLVMSFDMQGTQEGDSIFTVGESNLQLPAGLHLYNAEPDSVRVDMQRLVRRWVPVRVQTSGALPDSLELVVLQAEPDSILLTLPANTDPPDSVVTQPLDLREVTRSTTLQQPLVLPPRLESAAEQTQEVRVTLGVRRISE
ncbi:MAG TPA: diadenylate cyclase [Chloroflexota bacterium]|nr:diadenylate cyclase [Chloroflexota bacterium]